MPSRRAADVADDYAHAIQRVVSCITNATVLNATDLFDDGRELLAYHWHDELGTHVSYPHVHLEAGCEIGFAPLHKAHLPTGSIGPEELIRLAIEALGIQPLRDDWRDILEERNQRL